MTISKAYTQREITDLCKDVSRTRIKLMKRVEEKGLYENFGQKEVRALRDKHIVSSRYDDNMNAMRTLLDNFSDWCSIYTGRRQG